MRLSRFTDLGLRALMYVGSVGRRVSAGEIAEAYGVSKNHMMKSLQALVAGGILSSTPGRLGGFDLEADPEGLRLGAVVRRLEPSMALAECFTADSRCPLTPSCELSTALREARDAFIATLDHYTLADLIAGSRPMLVRINHA